MARLELYAHKDYRPIIRAAIEAGWDVAISGNGHMRFRDPDTGQGTTCPVSKPDPSYFSRLRRAGVPGAEVHR